MKLVFLGTAGYHPNDARHTAGLMIPELGLMLDAGTGTYRAVDYMVAPHLDIFITHAHLDHVIGLTYLLDVMYVRELERVTIHSAASTLSAIQQCLFAEPIFPVMPKCEFRPLSDRVALGNGGWLSHFPLAHPGGCIGFRLDWADRSLAYVSDTTARPGAPYIDKLQGVDLLIHECNFPDGMTELAELTGHSCVSEVAKVAREAQVKRLVLTHFNPLSAGADPVGLDAACRIFPATQLAVDRLELEF